MHQIRLAALIICICVCVPAGANDTPKKVSGDELIQIVAASQSIPDADLAKKLSELMLTDRLTGIRLAD